MTDTAERLDRLAAAMPRAELKNMIHAARDGHPLGRDNAFRWRNAWMAVCQAGRAVDVRYDDHRWIERMAQQEAANG